MEELLKIKLNPDNIKSAIESFANSPESESFPYFDYKFAHIFVKSFLDLFDKIPNDGQYKVDPIIINRCIRKFDVATEPVKLESESILKIMEYTDCEKQIPPENKNANAIIDNFRLLADSFEVPYLFIKFTFKFMDFEKLKQPQQESIDEKNARYKLTYDTIYALVDPIGADNWFDAFKRLLQDDIYNEFVDTLNGVEDIYDILSFETMDKFNSVTVKNLKRYLQKEHLKFVVKESKNGNKKIGVVVEENYVCQGQKSKSVYKIKIPHIAEIKSINDENKVANKWILKIFFIPNKNKNKWIIFCVDVVLFLIIVFAFTMPYFTVALAFLYSIFALSLEIICGLLSLAYGIVLLENICCENESNGKIHIKGNEGKLISKPITENNKGKILHLKLTKKNGLNLNK